MQLKLSCDGTWDGGRMPCRAALPTRTTIQNVAELVGRQEGWSITTTGDFCPAHTRLRAVAPEGVAS